MKMIDENWGFKIKELKEQLINKQIPDSYSNDVLHSWLNLNTRREVIQLIGFSLVSLNWIKPLAQWIGNRKCLEIMSGIGSLAFALQQQNVNVIATDNFSWQKQGSWNETKTYWTDIENIDCIRAISEYGKDVDIIICSWAFMDDTLYRALLKMREVNPDCLLIFIGEDHGGCTADDEFFDNVVEITDDEEFNQAVSEYQQWFGIHDYVRLGK